MSSEVTLQPWHLERRIQHQSEMTTWSRWGCTAVITMSQTCPSIPSSHLPPSPAVTLTFCARVNDHTSELILNNNLHHLCTHTVDAVCTDSMHTAAYTQIQTYWSTITHMHACAPETWQLGFRETYKHLISMTGEVGGCIWDGGETNWLERCFLPSKCVMSPQQVHTTCGESRKETKVCLRGWSQLCALQSSFAVCVVYECMNLRR